MKIVIHTFPATAGIRKVWVSENPTEENDADVCQNITEQMDRRYRRDSRVSTYRLERVRETGRLRWQLCTHSEWFGPRWNGKNGRASRIVTGAQRARGRLDKTRPVFTGVRHNSYLTPTQARRLAFMAGVTDNGKLPPTWLAMDWINEDDRGHPVIETAGMSIEKIEAERDAAELAAENEWRDKYED